MISQLFKDLCNGQAKRTVRRAEQEDSSGEQIRGAERVTVSAEPSPRFIPYPERMKRTQRKEQVQDILLFYKLVNKERDKRLSGE